MTNVSPDLIALGSEIRAMMANKYAHHIVATPAVIFSETNVLNELTLLMEQEYAFFHPFLLQRVALEVNQGRPVPHLELQPL